MIPFGLSLLCLCLLLAFVHESWDDLWEVWFLWFAVAGTGSLCVVVGLTLFLLENLS